MVQSTATISSELTFVLYSMKELGQYQRLCTQYLVRISLYVSAQQTRIQNHAWETTSEQSKSFLSYYPDSITTGNNNIIITEKALYISFYYINTLLTKTAKFSVLTRVLKNRMKSSSLAVQVEGPVSWIAGASPNLRKHT